MVKSLTLIKTKHFLKRELVLAITMLVIAFSFLDNFASAAEMKISDREVERIKTALDIINTASNFGSVLADGGNLMAVLKTAIKGGQTAADVTYGLLVLSAINEMEFMDMVLSQDYKDEARQYFNNILDERTNLTSYWKGIGFDIPRVLSGNITGPMGALTLNTFAITDKVILILTAFKNLQTEIRYDGLWYYFDFRRGGDSHEEAWELAEEQMGWAAKSTSLYGTPKVKANNQPQLEDQFAALYEKWGPYATPYGISKEYKEQLAGELRNTLAAAIEEHTENGSLYAKEPSLWDKLSAQLASIKNAIANIASQVKNPFFAGPIVLVEDRPPLPAEDRDPAGVSPPQTEKAADVGFPPVSEQVVITTTTEIIADQTEPVATSTEPIIEEPKPEPEPEPPLIDVGRRLCQKEEAGVARQYRVLINEVAWMGNDDSSNNEWIELKNIWGIPVNLAGWQLQDKDQQIKVIFEEGDAIPAAGYYLLERTDDNSLPNVPADKIYTGALSNSDEALYLFDSNCQLEDEIAATPDWPGGDNMSKKPMQRFDVLYWYTGIGSAGFENGSPPEILTHPSASAPAPKSISSLPAYPKIIISETYTGSPGNQKNDFVELYNPNNENANLTDWYVQRKTQNAQDFSSYAPNTLFAGKTILSKGYFLIANASSTFATSADAVTSYALTGENTLVLKNPNGEIVDEVSTGNPPSSRSHGRKWSTTTESYGGFENQNPTPKTQNVSIQSGDEGGFPALSVIINEVAWTGTEAKNQDEWIELFNNTTSSINLANWRLAADDGGPDITFPTSTITAGGYFLIERTDDSTIKDVLADWSGSFGSGLNNNGEILELYDNLGNLIDSVDAFSDWPAGDNSTKQTMERINPALESGPDNWASNNRITRNGLDADNNRINGTPKAENSVSKSFTEVEGGLDLYENFTLTYLGSPYSMMGQIYVRPDVKLIIEPGVVVKFKNNPYWQSIFKVEGQLEAIGGQSENQKIIFTSSSTEPLAGDWQGVHFKENSSSTLDNVVIKYADTVKIEAGRVSIKNSTIEKSQSYGLWIINSSPEISSSTFSNNNKFSYTSGIYAGDASSTPVIASSTFIGNSIGITAENKARPQITENVFKENGYPIKVSSAYPYVFGNLAQNNTNGDGVFFTGAVFQDAVWQANLPYILENTITIADGAELTIEPGTVVKLNSGSNMLVNGALSAQGEEENQIIFTSITDSDPENNGGYYIYFNSSSEDSIFNHAIVRYGGYYINDVAGYRAAITAEDASISVLNSVIEKNFFAGAYLDNSESVIQNTIFRDNNVKYSDWGSGAYSKGLYLVNSSDADLSGSHFERNYHGIYIEGDCPDLSEAVFGNGDNANTYDIYPDSCVS